MNELTPEMEQTVSDLYNRGDITFLEAYKMRMYAQGIEPEQDPDLQSLKTFYESRVEEYFEDDLVISFQLEARAGGYLAGRTDTAFSMGGMPQIPRQRDTRVAEALEYIESVYERHRAPGSPKWDESSPRVEKYLRHLYSGHKE